MSKNATTADMQAQQARSTDIPTTHRAGTPLMQLARGQIKRETRPKKQTLFPKVRVKIKSFLGCSVQDNLWGYVVEDPDGQQDVRWLPVYLKTGSFIEESKDLWQ